MPLRAAIVSIVAIVVFLAAPGSASAAPGFDTGTPLSAYVSSVAHSISGVALVVIVASSLIPALAMMLREKQRIPDASH
jgi:hypothetical protein